MASLRNEAIKGMSWAAIEKFTSQAIAFILGIIMARLLAPADYGVIGMTGIFIGIAGTLVDSGLGTALIQKKEKKKDDYSTLFVFNFGISTLLYLILFIAAPWIAEFYKTPVLKDVTRVITFQLVLNALFNAHYTKLRIDLQFKAMSIISLVSQIMTGCVGVFFAFIGWGVWALVWQTIFSCIIRGLMAVAYLKWWMPGTGFSKDSFRYLFGFGSKILASSLINTIYGNVYTLIIGKKFTPDEVGHYTRGGQLATFPANVTTDILVSVNYPILARLQDDNAKLVNAYRKMLTVPLFALYPILVGMAVLGEPFIGLLLGEKWLPCVPFLQIIAIGAMFTPLTHVNLNLLYVKGRTDLVLKLEIIKKTIAFSIVFLTIPFGIIWMLVGKSCYDFIAFSINCHYTGKILGYGWKKQMKEILPIILKSLIMGAIVFAATFALEGWWAKVLIGVPCGMVVYFIIAIVTKDSSLTEIWNIAKEELGIC